MNNWISQRTTFCCWVYSFVCQVPKGDLLYAKVHRCPISLSRSIQASSYTFNRGCISHFLSSVLLIDPRGDMMLSSTRLPGCHTISAWIVMTRRDLSFEVVAYILFWHLGLGTVYLEFRAPAESITPYCSERHKDFWWGFPFCFLFLLSQPRIACHLHEITAIANGTDSTI